LVSKNNKIERKNKMTNTKIYATVLEDIALKQFNEAMSLKCNIQGVLMPDAHTGYTLPIGAVIKSDSFIFPAYVGYDIGCGMCAVKLEITKKDIDFEGLKKHILKTIPIGFTRHKIPQEYKIKDSTLFAKKLFNENGNYYLGTLGGGNHFIELGYGKDDKIWIVIHSGSRGFGYKIAQHYMQKAASINGIDTIKSKDIEGHFGFDINSADGEDYILDMKCAWDFALANRKAMIDKILEFLGNPTQLMVINKNHNHAEIDNNFVIHRKGATNANKDEYGVIPGNMKDGSFIVKGKGCEASLCSSSHGAGRVLSRVEAKNQLNLNEFNDTMKGIVTNHTKKTLDESPKAYKDIFEVMELQKDLVEVIDHIKPLFNIKG